MPAFIIFLPVLFFLVSGCVPDPNPQPETTDEGIAVSNVTSDLSVQIRTENSQKELKKNECVTLSAKQLKSAQISYRPTILNQRWIIHCNDHSNNCNSAGWWTICRPGKCYVSKGHYEFDTDYRFRITKKALPGTCSTQGL